MKSARSFLEGFRSSIRGRRSACLALVIPVVIWPTVILLDQTAEASMSCPCVHWQGQGDYSASVNGYRVTGRERAIVSIPHSRSMTTWVVRVQLRDRQHGRGEVDVIDGPEGERPDGQRRRVYPARPPGRWGQVMPLTVLP